MAVVSVNEALKNHRRLVVLGDPGSGKTTLLRYLALLYSRARGGESELVQEKLGLDEGEYLPLFLELRHVGRYLDSLPLDGQEGYRDLLDLYNGRLKKEGTGLPSDLETVLKSGQAIVLLDGLDEVAAGPTRNRVARLVDNFTRAYPDCRYVLTCRTKAYVSGAVLDAGYEPATVRDFSLDDVEQFLTYWYRIVEIGEKGDNPGARASALEQKNVLMQAIRTKEQIRILAINPLMLTVIALVHKDRVKLPDRRAELYAEAVSVLLGKWDEVRNIEEQEVIIGKLIDANDKRLILQSVALWMQEREVREIDAEMLRKLLTRELQANFGEVANVRQAATRFIDLIEERAGLLIARELGVYAFSHLTFQEYLAAAAIADREDYIDYTLKRTANSWWREVILLEAGHLSLQGKQRTNKLVEAIVEARVADQPYNNLVLAAHCYSDLGEGRLNASILSTIQTRLKAGLETPPSWSGEKKPSEKELRNWIQQRAAAMEALVQSGSGYWSGPYGEPEWVTIPAGPFRMGEDNAPYKGMEPAHTVNLPEFQISRVPITNAQYALFVKEKDYKAPRHWEEGKPPEDLESHPVVYVSWYDALEYCQWLGEKLNLPITLPSEAEWEKAAGWDPEQQRTHEYPWGKGFKPYHANTEELGLNQTTPVGIFPEGESPLGVLDMSGNGWEWTRSLFGKDISVEGLNNPDYPYPYDPHDGRENLEASAEIGRVLRGGSFVDLQELVRVPVRNLYDPGFDNFDYIGFRVCVRSPISS